MAAAKKFRRTSYLIMRLDIATRSMLEQALRGRGVTLTQYTVLSIVSDVDGMSSADMARRKWNQEILRIELPPRPEPSADIDLNHVDSVFLETQQLRKQAAVEERDLRRAMDR